MQLVYLLAFLLPLTLIVLVVIVIALELNKEKFRKQEEEESRRKQEEKERLCKQKELKERLLHKKEEKERLKREQEETEKLRRAKEEEEERLKREHEEAEKLRREREKEKKLQKRIEDLELRKEKQLEEKAYKNVELIPLHHLLIYLKEKKTRLNDELNAMQSSIRDCLRFIDDSRFAVDYDDYHSMSTEIGEKAYSLNKIDHEIRIVKIKIEEGFQPNSTTFFDERDCEELIEIIKDIFDSYLESCFYPGEVKELHSVLRKLRRERDEKKLRRAKEEEEERLKREQEEAEKLRRAKEEEKKQKAYEKRQEEDRIRFIELKALKKEMDEIRKEVYMEQDRYHYDRRPIEKKGYCNFRHGDYCEKYDFLCGPGDCHYNCSWKERRLPDFKVKTYQEFELEDIMYEKKLTMFGEYYYDRDRFNKENFYDMLDFYEYMSENNNGD